MARISVSPIRLTKWWSGFFQCSSSATAPPTMTAAGVRSSATAAPTPNITSAATSVVWPASAWPPLARIRFCVTISVATPSSPAPSTQPPKPLARSAQTVPMRVMSAKVRIPATPESAHSRWSPTSSPRPREMPSC